MCYRDISAYDVKTPPTTSEHESIAASTDLTTKEKQQALSVRNQLSGDGVAPNLSKPASQQEKETQRKQWRETWESPQPTQHASDTATGASARAPAIAKRSGDSLLTSGSLSSVLVLDSDPSTSPPSTTGRKKVMKRCDANFSESRGPPTLSTSCEGESGESGDGDMPAICGYVGRQMADHPNQLFECSGKGWIALAGATMPGTPPSSPPTLESEHRTGGGAHGCQKNQPQKQEQEQGKHGTSEATANSPHLHKV